MQWLHTWAGLVLGTLLFAIFWMGTLSVFDQELDRWMMPETRFTLPAHWSLDEVVVPAVERLAQENAIIQWGATLPDERRPYVRLFYQLQGGGFHSARIDSRNGEMLGDPQTLGATGFIFPFHYRLHLNWLGLGYWLVGLAAMAMLALLVSGVVIHKKIFRDIFTFRPGKSLPRSSLDMHNLSAVAFLPFHFLITLSGLIIFIGIYFPGAADLVYAHQANPGAAFFAEAGDGFSRPPSAEPLTRHVPLNSLVERAQSHWRDDVGFIRVFNHGDASAVVQLGRSVGGEISWNIDKLFFDAGTGELLKESVIGSMMTLQRFFVGFHFVQFEHWLLRWLYFIGGLAGCAMIGTGFLFWIQSRQKHHLRENSRSRVLVGALSLGSTLGLILATVAFFLINRILPPDAAFMGWPRAELEVAVFALVWVAAFVHPLRCFAAAARQLCMAIALVSSLSVIANWFSTGETLWISIDGAHWGVAGTDMMLLALAGSAALAGGALRRRALRRAMPALP
ncbi:MAG: PepSY-associated TM helix domain-containing protein [Porticoccaceae bacterium]